MKHPTDEEIENKSKEYCLALALNEDTAEHLSWFAKWARDQQQGEIDRLTQENNNQFKHLTDKHDQIEIDRQEIERLKKALTKIRERASIYTRHHDWHEMANHLDNIHHLSTETLNT